MQKTGIFDQAHTTSNQFSHRIRNAGSILSSCLFHNPFLSLARKKVLIFDHPRKIEVNGEYIDIYTKYFIDDLLKEHVALEVYEDPYLNRHLSQPTAFRKHTDFIWILIKLVSALMPNSKNKELRTLIGQLEQDIKTGFGCTLNLEKLFLSKLKQFKIRYFLLKTLLRIKKPEKIFLVVGYEYAALIAAAKSLGIKTVELQHGVITDYNLGYSFPGRVHPIAYFPDELYVWNDFWKSMCDFPIKENRLVSFGFGYMNVQKEKYAHVQRDPKQILVISQGTVGNALAKYFFENRNFFENYSIVFKLHPGEYSRWRTYSYLTKLSTMKNVFVLDNDAIPLYELFKQSTYTFGVYSTALYEAIEMGCRVFVLDLPGAEHMQRVIETKRATLLSSCSPITELD